MFLRSNIKESRALDWASEAVILPHAMKSLKSSKDSNL